MATDTVGDALLLLSKVSSNLDKKISKLEESVMKISFSGKGKENKIVNTVKITSKTGDKDNTIKKSTSNKDDKIVNREDNKIKSSGKNDLKAVNKVTKKVDNKVDNEVKKPKKEEFKPANKVESFLKNITGDRSKDKPKRLVKKSDPVVVTNFGRAAEKDLKNAFVRDKEEKEDPMKSGGGSFIKKIIGPALLVLGGLAALVSGLTTDGPLKGLFKILSKGGIIGGIKLFQKLFSKQVALISKQFAKIMPKNLFSNILKSAKGFLGQIGKFLITPFKTLAKSGQNIFGKVVKSAKGFLGQIGSFLLAPFKMFAKGGAKGLFGKISGMLLKFVKPVITKIPGIGSLISFSFAVSRFKQGQVVRGLIDVASGIASFFPGIGTAIAIGLDVLNAFLDVKSGKEEKVKQKGKFKIGDFFKKIVDTIMNNFPIKNLLQFYGGVGKVFTGNLKEGMTQMAFALPFMKPLAEFLFGKADEDTGEKTQGALGKLGDFLKPIKDKIFRTILKVVPEKIFGFSVRARLAKMLGVDMGSVVDEEPSDGEFADDVNEKSENKKQKRSGRKNGGPVSQGTEYIVGESGPEIFVPEQDGFVVSNKDMLNLLDKNTFLSSSRFSMRASRKHYDELVKNNQLLTQILQKINTNNTIVTNNNNTNTTNVNSNESLVKTFRESYAYDF